MFPFYWVDFKNYHFSTNLSSIHGVQHDRPAWMPMNNCKLLLTADRQNDLPITRRVMKKYDSFDISRCIYRTKRSIGRSFVIGSNKKNGAGVYSTYLLLLHCSWFEIVPIRSLGSIFSSWRNSMWRWRIKENIMVPPFLYPKSTYWHG